MNKFAIIESGGKQYRISTGDKVRVEKLPVDEGGNFIFDKVLLLVDGENIQIGTPYISGATIEGKIIKQAKDKKKIVFRYHSKTRYRKKKGHRQLYTEVQV